MTPLHRQVQGPADAPALLLGGSLGTSLAMWEHQAALAHDRRRLIPFDHRGHGSSSTPPGPYEIADLGNDVLELMDDLGLARASYCGLSIGGMVGMWLAINAPERIDRLILICTSAHLPPATGWRQRAATVITAGTVEPIADAVVDRWLTPAFATARPDVRDSLRAMLCASPAAGYAACCAAIERMDLRDELSAITAPTLIVSGAEDQATSVDHQSLIAAAVSGARHEVISPAAHIAAIEQSTTINELIEEHLS